MSDSMNNISVRTWFDSAPDPRINEIAERAAAAGKELTVKVQPCLYVSDERKYLPWRGAKWAVRVGSLEEAEAFNRALAAFFQALPFGAAELQAVLEQHRMVASQ
jgi:hypothetical protein